jgi:hypothetical protein
MSHSSTTPPMIVLSLEMPRRVLEGLRPAGLWLNHEHVGVGEDLTAQSRPVADEGTTVNNLGERHALVTQSPQTAAHVRYAVRTHQGGPGFGGSESPRGLKRETG